MVVEYKNPLAQKIYNVLVPLVGPLMAESTVRVQSKKAGTTPEYLSQQHLPLVAGEIEKALVIFVGTGKAQEVAQMLRSFR